MLQKTLVKENREQENRPNDPGASHVLLIIFGVLIGACALVFWVASLLLQSWLYNDVPRLLPVRALVAGLLLALFHTAWCSIYKADPGRFDTLTNFKSEVEDQKVLDFQSIRRVGKDEKKPVRYQKAGSNFVSSDGQKPWRRSDADGMVVAILVPAKEKDGAAVRFNAKLEPDGTFPATSIRFEEEKGRRYMDEASMGVVYRKRSMSVVGNLFANFIHAVLWVVLFWLAMRFAVGHAMAIGLGAWAFTMIVVQPALFSYLVN